jgi:hypothetical protein
MPQVETLPRGQLLPAEFPRSPNKQDYPFAAIVAEPQLSAIDGEENNIRSRITDLDSAFLWHDEDSPAT